jgi:hypothetical protein
MQRRYFVIRKLLLMTLILAVVVSSVDARRGAQRAGNIKKDLYEDGTYAFTLKLNDEWNTRVQRDKDSFRLVLLKKRYEIPADYQDNPDYTQVPRLVVFAQDGVALGAFAMLDSLLSRSYSSDVKSEMLKEFEILQPGAPGEREEIVTKGRETFEVGGQRGILWTGQVRYMKEIAVSASALGGKRVRGGYGGAIALVKNDDLLVGFHLICEWQYFDQNLSEAMKIIGSLDFGGKEKDGK